MMRVLVACEFSATVRLAFAARGHDAWSCDLLDSEVPGNHITGDVREILTDGWDLMIAHPPCTYLAYCGLWCERDPRDVDAAIEFARALYDAPIPRVCIENPRSKLSIRWRRPDDKLQPWGFGDPIQKEIWLWLRNLPPLEPDRIVIPAAYGIDVTKGERSRFFPGVARAMAEQWG